MSVNERIKSLKKVVIGLITGLDYGDKVLYYDDDNKRQYGKIRDIEIELSEAINTTKPKVLIQLRNLENDRIILIYYSQIVRKLTPFDLQSMMMPDDDLFPDDEECYESKYIQSLDDIGLTLEEIEEFTNEFSFNDNINHPEHYTKGEIECIDYIEDKDMNYRIGNAVKYLTRYRDKGNPIEDLEKAKWYINREIEKLKEE